MYYKSVLNEQIAYILLFYILTKYSTTAHARNKRRNVFKKSIPMPRFVSIKYREYAVVSDKERLKVSSIHILFPLEK